VLSWSFADGKDTWYGRRRTNGLVGMWPQYRPVGQPIRAQSRNLPSVFDIARRLGFQCTSQDMARIGMDLGV
jgi:hypothetical protein